MKKLLLITGIAFILLSSCAKRRAEDLTNPMDGTYHISSFSINGNNDLSMLINDYFDSTEIYFWERGQTNDGGYAFTFTSITTLKDTTYYNIARGGFTDKTLSEFYFFIASQKLYPGTNDYMAGIPIVTNTFPPLKPYQWHVEFVNSIYLALSTTYDGDEYRISFSKK